MNCFPCFSKDEDESSDHIATTRALSKKETPAQVAPSPDTTSSSPAQTFTFRELAMATKNFRQECLLGEGGFGRVFKGKLHSTGQVVAVKQLDRNGMHGNKEFLVEVLMLGLLQHPNLISLIGYCADGDQRLLVYEFMSMGSLENHLFCDDSDKKPMHWYTRMKIASGAARGLEYLHDKAKPPVIYRDLKPSNLLLDENFEAKLSDFGLAKLGAGGGKMHPTSRVMGTYGYSAPEYSSSGELTLKSDMYSFGVLLLELITGRKVIDTNRPNDEQNLVNWAQPIFREPKRFPELIDPRLGKDFPLTDLNQAVGICAMCLQEEPSVRPIIGDVVAILSFLSVPQPDTIPTDKSSKDDVVSAFTPPTEQKMHYENEYRQNKTVQHDRHSSDDDDEESSEDEESIVEQAQEGSSQHSVDESYNSAECGIDRSDEGNSHRFGDATDDSDNNEDNDSRKCKDSCTESKNGNILDLGHSSSSRSSSTKRTGSRRRKMVVTFKEPNLSSKRNHTQELEDESDPPNQRVGMNNRQESSSSSSSSESSSESEDEKPILRQPNVLIETQKVGLGCSDEDPNHRIPNHSINGDKDHRVFDKSDNEVPKLRHLKTR